LFVLLLYIQTFVVLFRSLAMQALLKEFLVVTDALMEALAGALDLLWEGETSLLLQSIMK